MLPFPEESMLDHPSQSEVVLYRCECEHCDHAERELRRLSQLYGARFTVKSVYQETYLGGQYAGWTTPMVYVNGQKISHYAVNVAQWEQAIKAGAVAVPNNTEGEIVDLVCYMEQQAKGSSHFACADACIKAGAPIGLLTYSGDLFLLLGDRTSPEPYQKLRELVGDKFMVSGTLFRRSGVQAMIVKHIVPVDSL